MLKRFSVFSLSSKISPTYVVKYSLERDKKNYLLLDCER